ncbi:MAG: hypothetical protein KBC95_02665, partial [Candidatus Peribacteraceae bacterium]|nr:hypothetical protein [Candidatus Peribacteraceae bacterium]
MPEITPPAGTPPLELDRDALEHAAAEVTVRVPVETGRLEVRDSALAIEGIRNKTWEEVHPAELGRVLLNAINEGRIAPATVTQLWPRQPWRMLEIFEPILSRETPMYQKLIEWRDVGQNNPSFEPNFRALTDNAAVVQRMEAMMAGLNAYLATQQASRQHRESLTARRSSNWIDGVWREYRRSINFQRDPALSAGLVIGGVMVGMWFLRDKSNFARWARRGAAFTVLAVFLRQRYGIQITEDLIARPLEQWGAPQMANAVRVFRDTLRAPFVGRDQAGSSIALIEHRLGLSGNDERTMLAGMLRMSPGKFINAYNAAKRAQLSSNGTTQLPDEVRELIREFQRNHVLADHVSGLPDAEKLRVFLKVADKFLATLPEGRDPQRALSFLESNFVTGRAYRLMAARANARRNRDGSLAVDATVTTDVEGLQTAAEATPNSDVTMLDVFLATAPDDFWNGPNSLQGFQSVEARRARELRDALFATARRGRDLAVSGFNATRDFVLTDVPRFFTETAWPRIQAAAEAAWPTIRDVGQWANETQYSFRKNTAVGQLLEQMAGVVSSTVGETITVSGREMRKLSVSVAWKRVEGSLAARAVPGEITSIRDSSIWGRDTLRILESDGAATLPLGTGSNRDRNLACWRAMHDLGIIALGNRATLDAPATTEAIVPATEREKLKLWLRSWLTPIVNFHPWQAATLRALDTRGGGALSAPLGEGVTRARNLACWRAMHDLGVIVIENIDELGAAATTEVRLSAAEAQKLDIWIRTWQSLGLVPGGAPPVSAD